MNKSVLKLTYSGVMAALTFIATSAISFPVAATNGYIHFGDGLVLSCGVLLGKKYGPLAAGIGSALADLYLGYAAWALPTFIIKALMAYVVAFAFDHFKAHNKDINFNKAFLPLWVIALLLAGLIMVGLYFVTAGIMYGNWLAAASSIPNNMLQYLFGIIIVMLLFPLSTRFRSQLAA